MGAEGIPLDSDEELMGRALPRAGGHLSALKPTVLRLLGRGYSRRQIFECLSSQQHVWCSLATFDRWVRAEIASDKATAGNSRNLPASPGRVASRDDDDKLAASLMVTSRSGLKEANVSAERLQFDRRDLNQKMNIFDEVLEQMRVNDMGTAAERVLQQRKANRSL